MRRDRHFKLVIFDLDGTLTQERSIREYIHKRLDKWHGFAEEYQKKFLAGGISYERFCELLDWMRSSDVTKFEPVITNN